MVVSRDRTPFLADGRADMNRSPNSANHRRRLRAYVGVEPSDPVDKVSNHLTRFYAALEIWCDRTLSRQRLRL